MDHRPFKRLIVIALILLMTKDSWASIAVVQTVINGCTSGTTCSATISPTAGNTLLVGVEIITQTAASVQTSDGTACIADKLNINEGGNWNMSWFHCSNVASGITSVTATYNTGGFESLSATEVSGLDTSPTDVLDAVGGYNSDATTTWQSGSVTPTASLNQIIASYSYDWDGQSNALDCTAPYSVGLHRNDGVQNTTELMCYQTVSSTSGSYQPNGARASSHRVSSLSGAYRATSAAARPALVASDHVVASGGSGATITTPSMNTTGGTLLVAVVTDYLAGADTTISDSKGNTWHSLTRKATGAGFRNQIWYSYDHSGSPLSVGSGHTVSAAAGAYEAVQVMAFSGTQTASDPFDVENGAVATTIPVLPGSITPSTDGQVIIAGYGIDSAWVQAVDAGFAITNQDVYSGGVHFGGGAAYRVQLTARAINPAWWSSNASDYAMTIASFKAGSGGSAVAPTSVITSSGSGSAVTSSGTGTIILKQ